MNSLLLGIDVGTTNAKALLATPEGTPVAEATAPIPLLTPRPGWVEQNAEDWWNAVVQAAAQAIRQARPRVGQIAAIGVSGQGCAATPIDGSGRALRPGIIWMDARSEAESQTMREAAAERIFQINGKTPAPYNFDPKLIWLQAHEPDVIERARYALTTTGYVNFRLTGRPVMNVSDASIPFGFDQARWDWSDELIAAFGIPRRLYPPVAACQEIIGTLTAEAAAAFGLEAGIPVIAGGEDTSAAGLSVGVSRPGQAMLSLGTGAGVYVAMSRPDSHPQLLLMGHVLADQWLLGGTIVAFGASLAWCRDLLGCGSYDEMTALAAESAPGARGLIFLPYLSGELQPINDGNARGMFIGLSLNTRRAEMIRAVMEGTAMALAHNLRLAEQVGATVSELRAVGGPTRSPLWCQILADVANHPVLVLKNNRGAPLGDIFLAAAAVGLIPDAGKAAEHAAQVEKVYAPNPEHRRVYDDLFAVYQEIYPSLRPQIAVLARH